jgi:hypothetical protein
MNESEEKKLEKFEFIIEAVFDGGFELIFDIAGDIISGIADGL